MALLPHHPHLSFQAQVFCLELDVYPLLVSAEVLYPPSPLPLLLPGLLVQVSEVQVYVQVFPVVVSAEELLYPSFLRLLQVLVFFLAVHQHPVPVELVFFPLVLFLVRLRLQVLVHLLLRVSVLYAVVPDLLLQVLVSLLALPLV